MNFLDDYRSTLYNALQKGELAQARALVQSFHRTKPAYDAAIYYLEAALCYYEGHYPLAALFAALGNEKYPDFEPLQELLSLLDDPGTCFDCSFLNRTLRIVIYEGVSGIMDYTAEQFRHTFELLGHEVFVFHDEDFSHSSLALLDFLREGIDFALLFNNIGLQITTDGTHNIWDTAGITCFDYLFDHPLYYLEAMQKMPEHAIVTCVDKNHVRYLKRFHPHIKHAFYFPLGGEYLPAVPNIPWAERPIDVLYAGSLKTVKNAPFNELSQAVTEYLLSHTDCTTEDAFETCMKSDLSELTDTALQNAIYEYRFTDMHINSHFRAACVSALVKSGIHVTVFGHGWEQTDFFDHPCFHYGGIIEPTECIQKMYQSKIVLNNLPWFKDGTHDRIFNAMLSHAVCVTDGSAYLRQHFKDRQELIYYPLDQPEKLPGIVRELLQTPELSSRIAENGYQAAVLTHSWENRAIELLTRYLQKDYQ